MKQQISGPVGAIIVVVVVGLLVFFGYTMFMKPASSITPDEMRKNMQKSMQQDSQLRTKRGGPAGAMPTPPGPGAGAPSGG